MVRRSVLLFVTPSRLLRPRHRAALLRWCGVELGRDVIVSPQVEILSRDVRIGSDSYVNRRVTIDAQWSPITIGTRVYIGPHVRMLTATHELADASQRAGTLVLAPVHVGDGAWIGASATILPGVTIGAGCVIAAGATVVRDCAPNGLYGGLPAVRIRDLPSGVEEAGRAQ